MTEEWRPVVGYEQFYEVSNLGRVRSLPRTVTIRGGGTSRRDGRIRKLTTHPRGHLIVSLRAPGQKMFCAKVHRLVLEAFVGPCPDGMECCHNNGDPADNRVENLRWGTHTENIHDRRRHHTNRNGFTGVTHCVNGHAFDSDNTYLRPGGGRACRRCARIRSQRYRSAA